MGIPIGGTADFRRSEVKAAYSATSAKVTRMRTQQRNGETVLNEYTTEEREQML